MSLVGPERQLPLTGNCAILPARMARLALALETQRASIMRETTFLATRHVPRLVLSLLILGVLGLGRVNAQSVPEMPRIVIDTSYARPGGTTITVAAGGNLQAAIDNAKLGDTIVVEAGATFNGPFVLPTKTGSGWIYIQSSAYSRLPAPGRRVRLSDTPNMPKVVAGRRNQPAISTQSGAHHYRFVGIEFAAPVDEYLNAIIAIGDGETTVTALPNNIVFDRCIVRSDPARGARRGIAMNGSHIAVVGSHVSGFKEVGADSQALWASNSPGPFAIINNYLEGAGENVMFGGSDPTILNVIPSDIEIRGNHFYKPLAWLAENWVVKNSLEFKTGRRAIVEGNLFENNWAAGQQGMTLVITPRNEDGGAPWTKISDLTIRYNKFSNVAQGISILGRDDLQPSQITERILIRDNVLAINGLRSDGTPTGTNTSTARLFMLVGGPKDVTIDHNTGIHLAGSNRVFTMLDNSPVAERVRVSNNLVTRGDYGFFASGGGEGTAALNSNVSTWNFVGNAVIGAPQASYPTGNFFPVDAAAVRFADFGAGNYRLTQASPYVSAATDGRAVGADIDAIEAALSGVAVLTTPSAPTSVRAR